MIENPQPERERIVETVFAELLAKPHLTEAERCHLERRRRELLGDVEQKRAA
jgi:hypothetical protein